MRPDSLKVYLGDNLKFSEIGIQHDNLKLPNSQNTLSSSTSAKKKC